MSTIQLDSIKVDDPLREDLGELGELMASIQQYGLLHPIVVDDKRRLIAGHRRLEACKRLGKKRMDVKFYGELSQEERREIELEENVQRKEPHRVRAVEDDQGAHRASEGGRGGTGFTGGR